MGGVSRGAWESTSTGCWPLLFARRARRSQSFPPLATATAHPGTQWTVPTLATKAEWGGPGARGVGGRVAAKSARADDDKQPCGAGVWGPRRPPSPASAAPPPPPQGVKHADAPTPTPNSTLTARAECSPAPKSCAPTRAPRAPAWQPPGCPPGCRHPGPPHCQATWASEWRGRAGRGRRRRSAGARRGGTRGGRVRGGGQRPCEGWRRPCRQSRRHVMTACQVATPRRWRWGSKTPFWYRQQTRGVKRGSRACDQSGPSKIRHITTTPPSPPPPPP